MNQKNNKRITLLILVVVIFTAAFLRFYKVDQVPPSLSWDEAANGYNAFSIANWGRDEWGNPFPVYFKSFEDDKNPVHIYLTVPFVRIFGLSEFSTRFAPALFGVLNVIVIFFLARALFLSTSVGIIASLILAVSPYALQFSRFNHEATFALFFFMFGLLMFLKGVQGSPKFIPVAFLSLGVDILTYHSAKVVVPPMILLLTALYFKDLWSKKKYFFIGVIIFGLILSVIYFNPALLGTARLKQASIPSEIIKETSFYKQTKNDYLGRLELSGQRYLTYFSIDYLFQTGDKIARHSTGAVGEFYKIDGLFLVLGLAMLIFKRSKSSLIVLFWAAMAPFPASAAGGLSETGHAGRALYMMGSWHLVAAVGYYTLFKIIRFPLACFVLGAILLSILGWEMKSYISYYYGDYIKRYAIEWQYGMKQSVEYLKDHNGYFQVYVTDARSQPYIFFLYYLQVPLPEYLNTVGLNETKSRPSNLVSFFDKYHFGDWDPIESFPNPGVLYVVTPSQYDGLRYKNMFDVKKLVKYLNGVDAFYLVSYP